DRRSKLAATPDGLLVQMTDDEAAEWNLPFAPECVGLECKSIGRFQPETLPKLEHVFQTHVQMGCIRSNGAYHPTHAILSYASAFDFSRVAEFVISFDRSVLNAARE